uniref:DNA primase n=1 Tax=Anthurium amnicola TaxID=1678845 RepID=A0A1D1YQ42_9ARAE
MPTARRALWPTRRVEKIPARQPLEHGGEDYQLPDGVVRYAKEREGETSLGRACDQSKNKTAAVGASGDYLQRRDAASCMGFLKHECSARRREHLSAAYGQWRSAQRAVASRMERQLQARWVLDEQIEAHLALMNAHYNRSILPGRPRDVAHLLMPQGKPTMENAATSWLGDWRPSAILSLVPRLVAAGLTPRAHRYLSEAKRHLLIEEAVMDEQMAEHQSICILFLQGGSGMRPLTAPPWDRGRGPKKMLGRVVELMRKVAAVVEKAQRLRYQAVEVTVRQVLDQAQAAEFLVALTGVQDAVHRMASGWRAQVGPSTSPCSTLLPPRSRPIKPTATLDCRCLHWIEVDGKHMKA